jgi:hypothetical protein
MAPERPLAADTSLEAERLQIGIWRAMTPAEKWALLEDLHASANLFLEAGIRLRHPHAGPEEVRMRRLCLTLGKDLVRQAYGFEAGDVS